MIHLFIVWAKQFSSFGRCSTESSMDHPPSSHSHCAHLETIYPDSVFAFLLDHYNYFYQWPTNKKNQYLLYRICVSLARLHIALPVLLISVWYLFSSSSYIILVFYVMRLIVMTVSFLLQGTCYYCSRRLVHFNA